MEPFRGTVHRRSSVLTLLPNKWEVSGWEVVDISTDANVIVQQRNIKTMKIQPAIKWTNDSTSITPTCQVWELWTPWEWLKSAICPTHWPPSGAEAKPHCSLPSHRCSLSCDLQALLDQASSKRTCLNVSPTTPLTALLWLLLLAPGFQLLIDKLLRRCPELAWSSSPLDRKQAGFHFHEMCPLHFIRN